VRLEASLKGGQKTGLFLDQRENRQAAARFAAGRRVLDLFCYTGGFGLHCAKAGAREVIGIDSSEPALKHARRNAEINELAGIRFERHDALNYLRNAPEKSFSMVVVDPPRFATSHLHKERALRMYYRLNMDALRALEPGGVFVTCSCSGRVNPFEWFSLLSSVARKQRRFLRVIEFRGAAPDHPHSPFCPESQYLKCVIAQVE
jgi:23S rRNA (cytosine1962-C5)-methyltransferase